MSEITPENKQRLTQIESEVTQLWNAAEDAVDQVHSFAKVAIVAAWECGKRLIEAKEMLGHGNFGLWEIKMGIPQPTGFRYMKLASNYSTVNDLPANKREAYLAIGLLPDKEVIEHDGNTTLKPSSHHLQFVNRWSNWWNQVKIGKVKYDRDQARSDLRPLYDWLKSEVYGNE